MTSASATRPNFRITVMSAQTTQALEEAIAAHIADEFDSIPTDWVLMLACTNVELLDAERTRYVSVVNPHTPYHSALGLVNYARIDMEQEHFNEPHEGEG